MVLTAAETAAAFPLEMVRNLDCRRARGGRKAARGTQGGSSSGWRNNQMQPDFSTSEDQSAWKDYDSVHGAANQELDRAGRTSHRACQPPNISTVAIASKHSCLLVLRPQLLANLPVSSTAR